MDTKVLENLGLSSIEARVYLALLELGSAVANKIAEKSGIHRRTVYDSLETLIEKGLVSFVIEANKKYYQVEDPKVLLDLAIERKNEINSILPALLDKQRLSKNRSEVNVYRGKKGLKNVFEDMFKTSKEIYLFGSGGKFNEVFGEIYSEQFVLKLKENKIKLKAIFSEKAKDNLQKSPQIEARFIKEEFMLPSSISIYGDKVLNLIFLEQPIGVLVKSKEMSVAYLKYFELLWKLSKK
jgi:sugar-specific transcriptional regulator TrmB